MLMADLFREGRHGRSMTRLNNNQQCGHAVAVLVLGSVFSLVYSQENQRFSVPTRAQAPSCWPDASLAAPRVPPQPITVT